MKKRAKVLGILLIVCGLLALAGCGSKEAALTTYDTGEGFKIDMVSGMTKETIDGQQIAYDNQDCILIVNSDSFATLDSLGYSGSGMDEDAYADLINQLYDLGDSFSQDTNNHPCCTQVSTNDNGDSIYNYITIRKGSDTFWIVNLMCYEKDKDTYQPQFEKWAATIIVD